MKKPFLALQTLIFDISLRAGIVCGHEMDLPRVLNVCHAIIWLFTFAFTIAFLSMAVSEDRKKKAKLKFDANRSFSAAYSGYMVFILFALLVYYGSLVTGLMYCLSGSMILSLLCEKEETPLPEDDAP